MRSSKGFALELQHRESLKRRSIMIPGPYAVCELTYPDEGSDAPIFRTIKHGYDTAEHAFSEIPSLAEKEGVPAEDLVVIKLVDKEDQGED